LGWSQELFAEKAIVSLGTIKAAESGNRLYPKTHRALVDAINKARAAGRPPLGALTLEFPVAGALISRAAEGKDSPAAVAETAANPAIYPEPVTEELEVNDAGLAFDDLIPVPKAVVPGEPPRIQAFEDDCLFRAGTDAWGVNDACEGMVIFGATGSGKTSGSGQTFARAYLAAGFGGLVLCAKPDEPALWAEYASQADRESDVVLFGADPKWSFNFLEHESRRQGAGANLTENLVNLFTEIAAIGAGSAGGSTSDPFWERAMKSLVRNSVDLLAAAGVPVTLHNMFEVVRSAPTNVDLTKSERWRQDSACWRYVQIAKGAVSSSGQRIDFHEVDAYWLEHFPTLGDRTRSSIVAMFITLAEALTRSKMRELFCSGTTVAPEDILAGKIVVIDLPVKEWGEVGRIAAVLWKYCFQKTVERRKDNPNGLGRPVFLWADECQYFISRHDALFQATARSSRAGTVYLTQSIPSLVAAVGAELEGRALVDSLLNNLVTKIFHANSDATTNEYATKLIGKELRKFRTGGRSVGSNPGSWIPSVTRSSGLSEQLDDVIHPVEFSSLKKGGQANGYAVDGVIIQMGRTFGPDKQRWCLVSFNQRLGEISTSEPPILDERTLRPAARSKDLGPFSKLLFPWRHFKGRVGAARWAACILIWGTVLGLGSLFAFVAWEGP
jgi:hypothetical protein